jgi:PII-like signaling protein
MNNQPIIERSLGKIQIYVKPKEKASGSGLMHKLNPKQLYRELVKYAKDDNLMNASVYQTHHGYSLHGKITTHNIESDNSDLFVCVELIDEKQKLETFCIKHAEALKGKMIVFKAVEFWEIK